MDKLSIPDALIYSFIGIAIVFAVLVVLIVVIIIMSALLKRKKTETAAGVEEQALAPGSCGEVSTFDVPDRTAAMVMAIVADKTQTPLNQLRFISIKEVKDGDK